MKSTVQQILQAHAGKLALMDFFAEKHWTFDEVDRLSALIARNLHARGVCSGDRIVMQLPNCPEYVFLHLGINRNGAVAVPVEPGSKHTGEILALIKPRLVVGLSGQEGTISVAELMKEANGTGNFVEHAMRPGDPIVILHTSGSTGSRPKGVVHTWSSMNHDFDEYGRAMGFDGETTILQPMSMNHADGWCFSLYLPLLWGSSVTLLPPFDLRVAFTFDRILQKVKSGVLLGIPEILETLCDAKPRYAHEVGGKLRCAITSSVKLTEKVRSRFESEFHARVLENYGLTETLLISYYDPQTPWREGSVGKLARGCQVKILDDEVVVKSPFLFAGYYGDPEATANAMRDGWFHTGDLGHVDEEGYLFLTGRRQEVLNWRGIKLNVGELSQQLRSLDRVKDATLVRHELDGNECELRCYVTLKDGAVDPDLAGLKHRVAELLPDGLVLAQVCIVERIPRGASGKVLVAELENQVSYRHACSRN